MDKESPRLESRTSREIGFIQPQQRIAPGSAASCFAAYVEKLPAEDLKIAIELLPLGSTR